jgi:hypothetical protein
VVAPQRGHERLPQCGPPGELGGPLSWEQRERGQLLLLHQPQAYTSLYVTRDPGLDGGKGQAAEAQVRQWRDEGHLPFPDFSPEQRERMRGPLVYPLPGSTEARKESNLDDPTPEDIRSARRATGKDLKTGGSQP